MKTTIEVPDELFREVKARAALQGESLRAFVCRALESQLAGVDQERPAWKQAFGRVPESAVKEVDEVVAREFGRVDQNDWL